MKFLPPVLEKERMFLYGRLVANGLIQALAMVAILFLVRFVFDNLAVRHGAIHVQRILWMGLGLIAVGLLQGLLVFRSRIDAARLGQGYIFALRMNMYDHLTSLSPRSLERRSEGAVILRFTGDLASIRRWITRGMAHGVVSAITTVLVLGVLAWFSWRLAFAAGLFLGLGLITSFRPGRIIRKTVKELRRVRAHLMANIGEQIFAMATVQAFGQKERERIRFAHHNQRVVDAAIAQARAGGLMRAVTRATVTVTRAVILILGAVEVAEGRTTVGTVAAAMTVAGLLSSRVRNLGRAYTYYQKAKVARHKIVQFFQMPSLVRLIEGAPDIKPDSGHLKFDHVTFNQAVRNITVVAEPGKVISLAGPNGAGKSTLLSLACRLIDPDKGRIFLDHQDIALHSLSSLRLAIGMASSDLPLLRGSISYNLRYRWPDAPPEELNRIQTLCGLDRMLAELPDGIQTRVLEGGRNLSLGQRQRVSLARAILGNPLILLLDEVDANLDAESGEILNRVLDNFKGTIIMVTHQAERIALADEIWYMDNGSLVRVEQRRKN